MRSTGTGLAASSSGTSRQHVMFKVAKGGDRQDCCARETHLKLKASKPAMMLFNMAPTTLDPTSSEKGVPEVGAHQLQSVNSMISVLCQNRDLNTDTLHRLHFPHRVQACLDKDKSHSSQCRQNHSIMCLPTCEQHNRPAAAAGCSCTLVPSS